MKVLLIYPYFLESRPDPADVAPCPIGLYWLAAALVEQGHQVEILNWFTQEMLPPSLEDFFRDRRPDLIGFSVLNANRWGAVEIARIARQVVPAAKIVFGGVGATCLWRHLLEQHPEIDAVVLGEGERTLANLAERWAAGAFFGWRGPYLDELTTDPWGNRYAINTFALYKDPVSEDNDQIYTSAVVCYSAGPDSGIDTFFNQSQDDGDNDGHNGWRFMDDDVGAILSAGGPM